MTQSLATPSETARPAPVAPRAWPVGAGPVAAAELAALAVLLASGPRSAAGIAVTVLGGLVALAALVRVHGRPAYRWPLVFLRHRARVRAVRSTAGRTDALDAVLPALETRVFTDRLGHRIGLVGDGTSWTALLHVTLPDQAGPAALEGLLRSAMAAPDIRPAAVQLVSWSVPEVTDIQVVGQQIAQGQPAGQTFYGGPGGQATTIHGGQPGQPGPAVPARQPLHTARPVLGHLPPRADAFETAQTVPLPRVSVLAAANGVTPGQPAGPATAGLPGAGRLSLGAKRTCWIAVRVRPRDCPHAVAARGGGEQGALRATAVAALRLARDLTEAGFPADVYDETDVRAQLRVSLGADPASVGTGGAGYLAPPPAEAWRWWSTGMLRQYCYRPRRVGDAERVLGRTASFPAVFTCTSLLLRRRRDGRLERRTLVRVGMPVGKQPADVDRAVRHDLAAPLVRLDGEHGATLHATMPLAI
jgi:type VII secretion protein EccE